MQSHPVRALVNPVLIATSLLLLPAVYVVVLTTLCSPHSNADLLSNQMELIQHTVFVSDDIINVKRALSDTLNRTGNYRYQMIYQSGFL